MLVVTSTKLGLGRKPRHVASVRCQVLDSGGLAPRGVAMRFSSFHSVDLVYSPPDSRHALRFSKEDMNIYGRRMLRGKSTAQEAILGLTGERYLDNMKLILSRRLHTFVLRTEPCKPYDFYAVLVPYINQIERGQQSTP